MVKRFAHRVCVPAARISAVTMILDAVALENVPKIPIVRNYQLSCRADWTTGIKVD